MSILPIVIAPNNIFKTKANLIANVNKEIQRFLDDMLETMYFNHAVGLGANMVGAIHQCVVVDLMQNGQKNPLIMVNPVVHITSEEKQEFEEASLSFPGISAPITRPRHITVNYIDYDNNAQELKAEGFLSSVLQHEIDYLSGKVFLDYLTPLKRSFLLKKMEKFKKHPHHHHVHDEHCNH
ncbi:Peptide deformylase 1 [Rickettsiales bacterium Ac37b]|nr:Peptide deformylase 1 [Rickettsiales bacterium Ac37b]